jgi:hypothetical protein
VRFVASKRASIFFWLLVKASKERRELEEMDGMQVAFR